MQRLTVQRSARLVALARRAISLATIDPKVVKAEYAVRGAIVSRAAELEKQLKAGQRLPFDKLIYCNIGNPQSLGQRPLTFLRQILSILNYPKLLEHGELFPTDVLARASDYLASIPGGVGAYSNSQGVEVFRRDVAGFISRRDGGLPADPSSIFLTDGASSGIKLVLNLCVGSQADGVLLPVPQYPLYSATLDILGGTQVPYYLEEDSGWALDVGAIAKEVERRERAGLHVRAMVVINPGNPTGQCLEESNIREILELCGRHGITLLADEVYQENIYHPSKRFHSFKSVLSALPQQKAKTVELASFHSISKGFLGECGLRGGYMELMGFSAEVRAVLYKLCSINLCSNLNGQAAMGIACHPPESGTPSYTLYESEKRSILESLRRRAQKLSSSLNRVPGIHCESVEGALYAFPRVELPPRAVSTAEQQSVHPDLLYCRELLESTGIVTVPGSGFQQKDGTFHYRTTILPPESDMDLVIDKLGSFHRQFTAKYT